MAEPHERREKEGQLDNASLSMLLAGAGDGLTETKARALRRASRHALVWPEEAEAVLAEGRALTELSSVGPWLARMIEDILEDPPETPEPDVTRRDFITMAEAKAVLTQTPGWFSELKGDLQMHSTYSDGTRAIVEMAMAAMDRGYGYIAITDHSKGLKIAGGIDEEVLAQQADEIADINALIDEQGHDFTVLRSIELNFGPGGEVDMDRAALAALDIVVGSFHSRLRVKDDQTARALGAARNPDVQVIGHPQGRMYGVRAGVQAEWGRVFDEGAARGKAFEINAQVNRQDLNIPMLELARESGVMFSIGTDAHSIGELDNVELSLAAAITAEIPKDRIINFMGLDELLEWVGQSRAQAGARS